jgi:predicted transcriptional regulator YdeE
MKFLKVLLVILVILAAGVIIVAMTKDTHYKVERSVVVDACYGDVWAQVSDFQGWEAWAPWNANDSTIVNEYTGTPGEVGAKSSWTGNAETTGAGSMEVTEVKDSELIYHLHFTAPYESHADGNIKAEQTEDGVKVTWGFWGEWEGFMGRIMAVFMDIDEGAGPMFDEGLANLKAHCEALPKPEMTPEKMEIAAINYVGKRYQLNFMNTDDKFYEAAFGTLVGYAMGAGLTMSEASGPMTIIHSFDPETYDADFTIAIAVNESAAVVEGFTSGTLPAGPALVGKHFGHYSTTGSTWEGMDAYVNCKGIKISGDRYEMYANDPALEPDTAKWETHIVFPVAPAVVADAVDAADATDGADAEEATAEE